MGAANGWAVGETALCEPVADGVLAALVPPPLEDVTGDNVPDVGLP